MEKSTMKMPKSIRETAEVRVSLHVPEDMRSAIRDVLHGEYEAGYFGEGLTILDIGANVGSFAIWASLRWPNSTIHCYEPYPQTFAILEENVKHLHNVICNNVAVYPSTKDSEPFWSRYAGDGEAGLTAYVGTIFRKLAAENILEVPVFHPRDLPSADIIKLDVEGGEAVILGATALQDVSLILLEYHDLENKTALEELLKEDFTLDYEESYSWKVMLPDDPEYRPELAGNRTGRMFFSNTRRNRLQKA
jgi:FkbM family methyltransferase